MPGQLPEAAEIAYFPGCTAWYVEQDIAQATACLLEKAGVAFTYLGEDEACCGIPMLMAGLWDTWEEIVRHNLAAMGKRGVQTVVTSCPACWLVWKEYSILAGPNSWVWSILSRPGTIRNCWQSGCAPGIWSLRTPSTSA